MVDKVILLIYDGLGDRPIKELGNLTPLEAAATPNMDILAQNSECGLMHTLGRGITPGSDVAHLAIFGYAPEKYYAGRGPIEVAGIGLQCQDGDVAMRGNFGTVGDDLMIKDRRAGRILETGPICEALDGMEIDGVKFIVKAGVAHRAGVIMRGKGLSSAITDADPHHGDVPVQKVEATDDTPEAKHTAKVLSKFLTKSHEILKNHEFNVKRRDTGELEANFLLVRGAGQYLQMEPFGKKYGMKGCCIAGGGLYKGVAMLMGMDVLKVEGASGLPTTNIDAKVKATLEQLKEYDFIFLHLKATDNLGEDGNFEGKKEFIERADKAMKPFTELPENVLLVITADHSTPCEQKAHSADPIPILFMGHGVRVDQVQAYNERACADGGLGYITGKDVMEQVMNLMGKARFMGA